MKTILQKAILLSISFAFFNKSLAQTTIYSENFEGSHSWILNVTTGVNGADNNFFTVSDNEGGVLAPGCGVRINTNKTLHITSVFNPSGGAEYDAGGLCGVFLCTQTNRRAESPVFSTIGFTNISVSFDFIGNGDALLDNASMWYNAGSGWTLLAPSLKSPNCGSGQGQWTYSNIALPIVAENNANVKIGFNWTNNDDGIGSDLSFAVNNIVISSSNLSVSEFDDLKSQIQIYPNPTKSILKIESTNNDIFLIINQLGQEVKKFAVVGNIINEINIEDLHKGVYFVKNSQSSYCKKIIID
jgi:hypothetical protein